VGKAYDVYTYLEPLYNDFRRVRVALPDGRFALSHVDEVVDDMLRKDYLFDVAMPHIPYRYLRGVTRGDGQCHTCGVGVIRGKGV
jgi:pre-mRNA-splicing factor 38A